MNPNWNRSNLGWTKGIFPQLGKSGLICIGRNQLWAFSAKHSKSKSAGRRKNPCRLSSIAAKVLMRFLRFWKKKKATSFSGFFIVLREPKNKRNAQSDSI